MDLNEYTKIQCFNCHSDILSTSINQCNNYEISAVCEECINLQSNQITTMKTQIQLLHKQLHSCKNSFQEDLIYYTSRDKEPNQTLESLLIKLHLLQAQASQIRLLEKNLDEEMLTLIEEEQNLQLEIDKQSEQLHYCSLLFQKEVEKQMELQFQLRSLSIKQQQLEKTSILNQLFYIHFDDNTAYINQQPVTFTNSRVILQIVCLLIDKYQYKGFTVNFCDKYIKTSQETIPIKVQSESSTISWVNFITREMAYIWQHIKQHAALLTHQSYSSFALPFNIQLKPKISIYGVTLTEGANYCKFLKYFTHNLKFMMNFDLNIDMTLASQSRNEN